MPATPKPMPAMFLAVGPWKPRLGPDASELLGPLAQALRAVPSAGPLPRLEVHTGFVTVDLLNASSLLAALDLVGRGHDWVGALQIQPARYPVMAVRAELDAARALPWGLTIRRDRRAPEGPAAQAMLATHLTVLRARRPAAWRAIDAKRAHGTGVAAAEALGCSHQAVNRQLRQANLRSTDQTATALRALLG